MIHLAASSSNIAIPNRRKVRERVKELAKESHAEVLAMIPRDGKVSIAADCWTSPTNKGFLAVTCYFFTEDFVYKEALLGFEPLHGPHDIKYLANVVLHVLDQCNCLSRVVGVTTDNASNNNGITEDYNGRLQEGMDTNHVFRNCTFDPEILLLTKSATHIPCLAHVIQLSVKALLDSVKVTAQNNDAVAQWDEETDPHMSDASQGLPSTLEKVCRA